jgi:hypothetical protein
LISFRVSGKVNIAVLVRPLAPLHYIRRLHNRQGIFPLSFALLELELVVRGAADALLLAHHCKAIRINIEWNNDCEIT